MHRKLQHRGCLVLPLALLAIEANVEPLHSASDCEPLSTNSTFSKSLGGPIWVYFENDFGTEFRSCLAGGSPMSGIANTDVINVYRRAMERPTVRADGGSDRATPCTAHLECPIARACPALRWTGEL